MYVHTKVTMIKIHVPCTCRNEIFAGVLFCRLPIFCILWEQILGFRMTDIICFELFFEISCSRTLKRGKLYMKMYDLLKFNFIGRPVTVFYAKETLHV